MPNWTCPAAHPFLVANLAQLEAARRKLAEALQPLPTPLPNLRSSLARPPTSSYLASITPGSPGRCAPTGQPSILKFFATPRRGQVAMRCPPLAPLSTGR